jgi:hypothetical protein
VEVMQIARSRERNLLCCSLGEVRKLHAPSDLGVETRRQLKHGAYRDESSLNIGSGLVWPLSFARATAGRYRVGCRD